MVRPASQRKPAATIPERSVEGDQKKRHDPHDKKGRPRRGGKGAAHGGKGVEQDIGNGHRGQQGKIPEPAANLFFPRPGRPAGKPGRRPASRRVGRGKRRAGSRMRRPMGTAKKLFSANCDSMAVGLNEPYRTLLYRRSRNRLGERGGGEGSQALQAPAVLVWYPPAISRPRMANVRMRMGQGVLQVQPGDAGHEETGREITLLGAGEKISEDDQGGPGQFRKRCTAWNTRGKVTGKKCRGHSVPQCPP